jgi:hypothetical protein
MNSQTSTNFIEKDDNQIRKMSSDITESTNQQFEKVEKIDEMTSPVQKKIRKLQDTNENNAIEINKDKYSKINEDGVK